ncbi:hypothetical protein B0H14DRAFT_3158384 [Mycena olivaceomarginata]|nr:hypothetical protein B0H14DRAFT_3158384 [Mycena olivaceomarginata]
MAPLSNHLPAKKSIDDVQTGLYIAMNHFLAVATISLFIFCTVHLALLLASTAFFNESDKASVVRSKPHSHGSFTAFNLNRVTNVIYVTSNVIADSIFVFRCYAIWNFQRKVIIFPTLSTLSAAAGRIWWAARKAREVVGPKMISRYYTVCAMILESGAIYCAGGIVFLILSVHHNMSEVVGIAPTIIAVRVGLGKSVESVDSFVAMAQPRVRGPRDIEPAFARSIEHRILDLRPEN